MIFFKLTQLPYSNGLVHMLDDVLLPNRGSYFIYLTNNLVAYQQKLFCIFSQEFAGTGPVREAQHFPRAGQNRRTGGGLFQIRTLHHLHPVRSGILL